MSDYLYAELLADGAQGIEIPLDERLGVYWTVRYRGFRLRWTWVTAEVAPENGFDRWANSRIWEGKPWTSLEEVRDTLQRVSCPPVSL